MKRRAFLSAGLAASALAAPAVAQSAPQMRWRLTSGFSQSFDIVFGGAALFAKLILEATDGKFIIETYASGEIAPGAMALDWASAGTAEMAHVQLDNFSQKEPALALASAMPFGLNTRQQASWFVQEGNALINDLLAPMSLFAVPMGNTGPQMAGWFKKELASPEDLKGLKIRASGLDAQILALLGAIPVIVSRNDIANALDKGDIAAATFSALYDDEKLGLLSRAPNLYYPAFARPATAAHLLIHLPKWNALPKPYQRAILDAAATVNAHILARYDVQNVAALRRLVGAGAKVNPLPQSVLEAAFGAAQQVLGDLSSKSANFKRLLTSAKAFRNEALLLDQTAAYTFDNFMLRHRNKD